MLDCSKIDELMMDWLYQELDPSSSARVAEHVEGCARCAAEATALQRTRAAFRDLSPVDPPVALSAILLHEAARRAPAAPAAPRAEAAEGGFWATVRSWFRPIALHPAAAAIATLVLIAGVAATLYVRHGDEMTDTQDLALPVPDTATAPPAAAGTAEEAPKAEPAAAQPAAADEARDDDQDGYRADLLGKEAQAELSREVAQHGLDDMTRDVARRLPSEKKAAPITKGGKKTRPAADPKGPIANAVSGADPLIEGEADLRGGTLGNSRGRASDKMEQAARPPPATPPASTGSTSSTAPVQAAPGGAQGSLDFEDSTVRGDAGGSYRAYKQKPMTPAELKASEGKLGAAVTKKDCVTAARIANDILDRNSDYYYKRVASQTKPCQMAVSKETQSRSARRASKNVGSGKNVAAPQKVKAAKQKDQASEAAE